jgi:hypothetical protein
MLDKLTSLSDNSNRNIKTNQRRVTMNFYLKVILEISAAVGKYLGTLSNTPVFLIFQSTFFLISATACN